jgi:hypothetical protein
MRKQDTLVLRILSGVADFNIPFEDLRWLLLNLGFEERIRSSHHIFVKAGIEEIINLQPLGSRAKAYQVRQVRSLMLRYKLGIPDV